MNSAIEMEAEAMRWAMQSLAGLGYTKVIFETDSLELSKMMNGEQEVWPCLKPLAQQIFHSLKHNQEFIVRYQDRSSNKVADRVAKETSTFMSNVPKLYTIMPVWLQSLYEFDKMHVRN